MDAPDLRAAPQGEHILLVDDEPRNLRLLRDLLQARGYRTSAASSGEEALAAVRAAPPDLVLLDVLMPGLDGLAVCRELRRLEHGDALPIVVVTSLEGREDRLAALDAGADDFLSKPIDRAELFARIRALLRAKRLYDEVLRQHEALAEASRTLEAKVAQAVDDVQKLSRLKRFFSPALVERIIAGGIDDPLRTHRREITVLFADLRGFTAFAEAFEAEQVMAVLREFHAGMGLLIHQHEGTLERFTGDGMMVFFNDPDPMPDHPQRAARLARAMIERGRGLAEAWRDRRIDLSLAIGISQGVATLGTIGFDSRVDYAAIGRVTNLAARLCAEARPWEILASESVAAMLPGFDPAGPLRWLSLKGFHQPVCGFTIGPEAA